ncbi:MAG: Hsp70 family protein [Deltaproteobacteria bacterium]|nr:Hsp70 family protein [Deltaproteobacteria bacterium]
MRFGIDLGTTRTLVAACDRGNYPVLSFEGPDGDAVDHVPTLSAACAGRLVHGWDAFAAAQEGAPHLRSWKRLLGRHGPDHRVRIGAVEVSLFELMTGFLTALRERILEVSPNDARERGAALGAVVSVPANAHSGQRWATLEAYRRAGFEVTRLVNEPSAAGIEFAHRHASSITSRREHVAVYDLGGGTFDAALVRLAEDGYEVVSTAGVQELGGDDFDRALAVLALERLGLDGTRVPDSSWPALLAECRAAKESIGASTRRVTLGLEALGESAPSEPIVLQVADYYERVRPLVERSLEALGEVLSAESTGALDLENAATEAGLAGVYVVGGASALPLVARHLRERFGRRVHRSPHPAGAIAIGLAIAADTERATELGERLTRHLGVFRESDAGRTKIFDRIFESGTPMPRVGEGPLVAVRTYRAAHTVGQLRFIECAALGREDEPTGDITPHATVHYPYERGLRGGDVGLPPITRLGELGPRIEERYEVDAAGVVTVTISDLEDGYRQVYTL